MLRPGEPSAERCTYLNPPRNLEVGGQDTLAILNLLVKEDGGLECRHLFHFLAVGFNALAVVRFVIARLRQWLPFHSMSRLEMACDMSMLVGEIKYCFSTSKKSIATLWCCVDNITIA